MTDLERQELKDQFVKYFEEVPVIKYAAFYIGVTEQTAHNWLKDDESFLSRVNQAKARWAKKRALKTKAEFQLERLDKEIWTERKELTGKDGEPITVIVEDLYGNKPTFRTNSVSEADDVAEDSSSTSS